MMRKCSKAEAQSKIPLEFVMDLKESMMHHDSTLCMLVLSMLLSSVGSLSLFVPQKTLCSLPPERPYPI